MPGDSAYRVVVVGAGFGGLGMAWPCATPAKTFAASASAAGADVTYTRWPGMWHDFVLQPGLVAAADSAVAQSAWFVQAVTAA